MQTYSKIWMHFVWATYKRERVLTLPIRRQLINHIFEYGQRIGVHLESADGYLDHIHLLVGLKPIHAPSEIANRLKGESSNWINKQNLIRGKFAWQSGYAVFTVSESNIYLLKQYILNQEEHHKGKSFGNELKKILAKHRMNS